MKVYLIKASGKSVYSEYKKNTGGPPQNIFSTAAATPKSVDIEMTDETIGMKVNLKSTSDIVAIFMSTPDAPRAYELADKFKARGKIIVLGGLHTKFMQEEAAPHADTLLIGEPEEIWEELLDDWNKGHLKERYERKNPFDLAGLKPYPTHTIHPKKYNYTWSVVVSRGCPNKCEFCLVHKFFDKYRFRPIENIVEELKELKRTGVEWVELHADNLTANRKYALDLFKALAPLNLNFFGETTIQIANDDELLKAAQEAGIKYLLFGLETSSEEALQSQGKAFVKPEEIKDSITRIKRYGIITGSDFIFGFDEHDKSIFNETIEFTREVGLDEVFPHLLIPFPGSETFRKLDEEGRILTKDWSKYDGSHAVYRPKKMTPEELEEGTYFVWKNQDKKTIPSYTENSSIPVNQGNQKWKTLIALPILLTAIWYNVSNVLFGLIFLFWSYYGIKMKQTFLVEEITQNENPVLFWTISILWILLSVVSIVYV